MVVSMNENPQHIDEFIFDNFDDLEAMMKVMADNELREKYTQWLYAKRPEQFLKDLNQMLIEDKEAQHGS